MPVRNLISVLFTVILFWSCPSLAVNGCRNTGNIGECVQVLSDRYWKPASSGIPTEPLVTRPASSQPWGSVIPNTRAQWLYVRSFDTGASRDPRQATARRFERVIGPGTPRYNVARAIIRITADNGYILYVNGRKIGGTYDNSRREYTSSADWRRYQTYDITNALTSQGSNTFMVDVYDHGGAAGFLLDGEIWCVRGKSCSIN